MPRFGSHLSIAGGHHRAVEQALGLGFDTVQVFTKSANQWAAKPLTDAAVGTFRAAVADAGFDTVTAHDSYLINLASPDDALHRKSIDAFVEEMTRAEALGLTHLVTHPGAHLGTGEAVGIARIVAAFDDILDRCADFAVVPLLETTAGQGTTIGHRFEHIGDILGGLRHPERVGVCFDTCHVVAAGYALDTPAAYRATWSAFDRAVGVARIRAFHLNDSKKPLGSRVDRHDHLGEGHVGEESFRRLVNDHRFRSLPMILETPKEDRDGVPMDAVNLARLRSWMRSRGRAQGVPPVKDVVELPAERSD